MSHLSKFGTAYIGAGSIPFAQDIARDVTTILLFVIGTVPPEVATAVSGLIGMVLSGAVIVLLRKIQRETQSDVEVETPEKPALNPLNLDPNEELDKLLAAWKKNKIDAERSTVLGPELFKGASDDPRAG